MTEFEKINELMVSLHELGLATRRTNEALLAFTEAWLANQAEPNVVHSPSKATPNNT